MAWTAPRTWTTGEVVTAPIMNTHVRDNLLETAPAKVTTAGDLVYATGANALARLGLGAAKKVLRVNAGVTAPEWVTPGDIAANAQRSAVQSISHATWTAINFDAEEFDTDGIHNTVTNNDRLTPQTAGRYIIIGVAEFAANATGIRMMRISSSYSSYIAVVGPFAGSGTNPTYMSIVAIANAPAFGEYFQLQVYQNSGGNLNIDQPVPPYTPSFGMARV